MLGMWLKHRRIFRAYYLPSDRCVHYFRPWLPRALKREEWSSTMGLAATLKDDALALFVHEAYWHGVLNQAGHTSAGIGAPGMVSRRGIPRADLWQAAQALADVFPVVVLRG